MSLHIAEAAFAHIDLNVSEQDNFPHLTLMSKYFLYSWHETGSSCKEKKVWDEHKSYYQNH